MRLLLVFTILYVRDLRARRALTASSQSTDQFSRPPRAPDTAHAALD